MTFDDGPSVNTDDILINSDLTAKESTEEDSKDNLPEYSDELPEGFDDALGKLMWEKSLREEAYCKGYASFFAKALLKIYCNELKTIANILQIALLENWWCKFVADR